MDFSELHQISVCIFGKEVVQALKVALPILELSLLHFPDLERVGGVCPLDNWGPVVWQKHHTILLPVLYLGKVLVIFQKGMPMYHVLVVDALKQSVVDMVNIIE